MEEQLKKYKTAAIVLGVALIGVVGYFGYNNYFRGSSDPINSEKVTTCDNPEIKGNISSSGEKIYHMPGQMYYGKTQINTDKGEKMFCTEDEAENAGWRKSKR